MNNLVRRLLRMLALAGVDAHTTVALRQLPRYWRERRAFRARGGVITHAHPLLIDYRDQAGYVKTHYFHQDLAVATAVARANPRRHLDVGSRIDGFVAHVASFRVIEVLDIRPLALAAYPNIRFVQADLMDQGKPLPTADSVSCLHALEHFGLGRYGDPLDPEGHRKGFNNLLRMVEPGGTFYVSFPVGRANEVHFNAHRVFHPEELLRWLEGTPFALERFAFVDDAGDFHVEQQPADAVRAGVRFGCGIYTLRRSTEK